MMVFFLFNLTIAVVSTVIAKLLIKKYGQPTWENNGTTSMRLSWSVVSSLFWLIVFVIVIFRLISGQWPYLVMPVLKLLLSQ